MNPIKPLGSNLIGLRRTVRRNPAKTDKKPDPKDLIGSIDLESYLYQL